MDTISMYMGLRVWGLGLWVLPLEFCTALSHGKDFGVFGFRVFPVSPFSGWAKLAAL